MGHGSGPGESRTPLRANASLPFAMPKQERRGPRQATKAQATSDGDHRLRAVLDRGPRFGFTSLDAQPSLEGVAVAWARWDSGRRDVLVRAALVDAQGRPARTRTLDDSRAADALPAAPVAGFPPPTQVLLSGGEDPSAIWSRLVTAREVLGVELAMSALGDPLPGTARTLTSKPSNVWPLSSGTGAYGTTAAWGELKDPDGGPVQIVGLDLEDETP